MNCQLNMRDIAEKAGVSVSTVSRVLNGNGRISPATRERVQAIIDETGYVVNMAARSLSSTRSGNVGLIVPDISNDFFSTLALHAEKYLAEKGYSVFVCNTANDPERERNYFLTLTSKLVDGVICISGLNQLTSDIVPAGLPVVCVDRQPQNDLGIPRVRSDESVGTYAATNHLIGRGCKHILHIGSYTALFEGKNRISGYENALRDAGLPHSKDDFIRVTGKKPSMVEAREGIIRRIGERGLDFDGIITSSDHAAAGALQALTQLDISVPGQVKICGFDDSIYSRLTTPTITTVHRYPEQLARAGCDRLLEQIGGETPRPETIIPVKLVVRESSGA